MNPRALIPLIAGLGIGGLALKLGINTLQNARAGHSAGVRVQVWSPKEDIPRGSEITAEMIQELAYPADLVPASAFKEKDKLVGRIPRVVAPAGVPLLETMLCPPGTKPGLYPRPGFRAIAVKIDASSGVDFHIEPGCSVDVLGSFPIKGGGPRNSQMYAKSVVENVEVAAVGPRTSPASGKDEPDKKQDRTVRAVTLFVTPDQAKKILLAEQQGSFKLCLRGNGDTTVSAESAADELASAEASDGNAPSPALDWLHNLFNKPADATVPPVPVALAMAPPAPLTEPWILKIYRGHDEETVRFKDRSSPERLDEQKDDDGGLFGNTPRRTPAQEDKAPLCKRPRPVEPAQTTEPQEIPEEEAQPQESRG